MLFDFNSDTPSCDDRKAISNAHQRGRVYNQTELDGKSANLLRFTTQSRQKLAETGNHHDDEVILRFFLTGEIHELLKHVPSQTHSQNHSYDNHIRKCCKIHEAYDTSCVILVIVGKAALLVNSLTISLKWSCEFVSDSFVIPCLHVIPSNRYSFSVLVSPCDN